MLESKKKMNQGKCGLCLSGCICESTMQKVLFLPQAEEEMNDTALFFYECLPERQQGLSVGIVKRIDETFRRFYLMH